MTEEPGTPALTVWRFTTASGAIEAARGLEKSGTADRGLGCAVVSWTRGTRTPRVEHLPSAPNAGELNETFWGLFFGLVLFMPLIGAALGGTTGTGSGTLADVGFDDTFINKVRDRITPGSSGLFVLTEGEERAAFHAAMPSNKRIEVFFTHLSPEQIEALRTVFGRK